MKRRKRLSTDVAKLATLTSPADSLARVEPVEEILSAYRRAFNDFSEGEMLLLDGIVLDPPHKSG